MGGTLAQNWVKMLVSTFQKIVRSCLNDHLYKRLSCDFSSGRFHLQGLNGPPVIFNFFKSFIPMFGSFVFSRTDVDEYPRLPRGHFNFHSFDTAAA